GRRRPWRWRRRRAWCRRATTPRTASRRSPAPLRPHAAPRRAAPAARCPATHVMGNWRERMSEPRVLQAVGLVAEQALRVDLEPVDDARGLVDLVEMVQAVVVAEHPAEMA